MTDRTVEEFEKETDKVTQPMSWWSRVIVETDEKHPKTLAVITNDDDETVSGLRVRFKPSDDLQAPKLTEVKEKNENEDL